MNKWLLLKTTSYGMMHIVVAFIVAYAITRDIPTAVGISLIEPAVQTVCFYFHEKVWNKFSRDNNTPLPTAGIMPPCCKMTADTIQAFQKKKDQA